MKLGLDTIRELLSVLGDPQKKFESIHIAGSNGKGSVSAMLAAVLQENGYKTGLYTSPHLVDFRERIKINGRLISEGYSASLLEKIWNDVERLHATFFEVATALALAYFADSGVHIAIIETGLGGRLDATNVLEKPLATVITSISLEHTAQLGHTLQEIAGEKAGIMKPGVSAIVNVTASLKEIFIERAKELSSALFFVDDYHPSGDYATVRSPFPGRHQEQNLRTVLLTLEKIPIAVKSNLVINGIAATAILTGIRARLEEYDYPPVREKNMKLILDVAHNPDAFKFLKEYFLKKGINPIVVAGFAKDKDIPAILKEIKQFASLFICVAANSHRAISSDDLAVLSNTAGIETLLSTDPKAGIELAITSGTNTEVVLLAGSHFVVGDFLKSVQ